jgi:uncharacterized protein YdbL (DUF1318 family)
MKQMLIGLALLVLGASSAFAISLHEAKSSGLVGERNDGYVGYVVTPPSAEVKVVVKDVNNKRKAKFSQSAKSNNVQIDQVSNRFYQRAISATKAGQYYQDASGTWVKK